MATATTTPRLIEAYATIDEAFDRFRYPAGESHIRLHDDVDISELRVIEATATNFDDLAQIVTADRILRRNQKQVRWFVPYFPFARHDRRNDAGDGFELKLALEMVAEIDIVIADPHSDVAGQLPHIGQAVAVSAFREHGVFAADPVVVIPDAGAAKKAYEWAAGATIVQASKHRDAATGKLSGFAIPEHDLGGRPCIIVDDICDGGGTFLGLAAELAKANAGPLTLAVTHGLFTKGTDTLLESFDSLVSFTATGTSGQAGVKTIPFSSLYHSTTSGKGNIT